ncbi:hypothetical protein DV736_g1305, partial [Chaetothyriales sp. CBS 134916]
MMPKGIFEAEKPRNWMEQELPLAVLTNAGDAEANAHSPHHEAASCRMSSLLACCGVGRRKKDDGATEPLLPLYGDEPGWQRVLQKKLHTYAMIKALGEGFMPSNQQAIINLRTLLGSDALNAHKRELSDTGRLLVRNIRSWLSLLIQLLENKNSGDQIQDFIYALNHSRISLDLNGVSHQASRAKAGADAAAAYKSFRTVGSLLLTNSDFRLFIQDVGVIGRQVLADTAFSLTDAAVETGNELQLSGEEQKAISGSGTDEGSARSRQESDQERPTRSNEIGSKVAAEAAEVAQDAVASARKNITSVQGETLLHRLKQAILSLRQRPDYTESVSTLSKLIVRYAHACSGAGDEALSTVQDEIDSDPALDRAVRNFWDFLSSFGDRNAWQQLEKDFKQVLTHAESDPQFDQFMTEIGDTFQRMLLDPDFFDQAPQKIEKLREQAAKLGNESAFRADLDQLLKQGQITVNSIVNDEDVSGLVTVTRRIYAILFTPNTVANSDLLTDAMHIFLPLLIRCVQYLPIPRLEISVPEMDLLLENLVLEPGRNVNSTSFLPYRLLVSTKNDLEIRKAHSKKTVSSIKSLVTITVNGLSVAAQDLGYWIRGHAGIVRFADSGIASFYLDERGIDIFISLEIGKENLEQILTLKGVRVHIHKLDYTLRQSKWSWLGWLFKPFLKQMIRRSLEKTLAEGIANGLHNANRELVFARERLRATRIADPQDIVTFIEAVAARTTSDKNPDVHTRLAVDAPEQGVFQGVYTPESIVKVWHDEALRAEEAIQEGEECDGGWRNEIFDRLSA